tara:strand:+ start:16057 stop:17163 length:1107 start_codon:yes stop_codon:yes gene_type:complete
MIIFADPKKEYLFLKKKINSQIIKVLNKGVYTLGEETKSFENNFTKYIGAKYSTSVNSGTDAIKISLLALGIGKGDEVITSSHTALATIAAIIDVGATPVLIDIDNKTYNLKTNQIKKSITKKTKAIIPVHIYGQSCDMNSIKIIANQHGLRIIEDCSQATGSKYKKNFVGTFGDIGCFSFYPTKNLAAFGDGGMISTNNKVIYNNVKSIKQYGWNQFKSPKSKLIGINSRLDEIQAAILNLKIKYLDTLIKKRINIAKIFNNHIDSKFYKLPFADPQNKHSYHLYVIQSKNRNKLIEEFKKHDVFVGIHYNHLITEYRGYKKFLKVPFEIKNTKKLYDNAISIPNHPYLKNNEIKKILKILEKYRYV